MSSEDILSTSSSESEFQDDDSDAEQELAPNINTWSLSLKMPVSALMKILLLTIVDTTL